MIRIGQLRRTVTLKQAQYARDSFNVPQPNWTAPAVSVTVRAKIEEMGGVETNVGGETRAISRVKITIRYYTGLDPTWRIDYAGKTFAIQSTTDLQERHRYHVLDCLEVE